STDGISWHLSRAAIITPEKGQYRVGTPAQSPGTAAWVYFASTAQKDSMGFAIRFATWAE
ncbi:MAG: hypothetical protein JO019_03360, partial [Candidatus Kaiserbacteria bacterium]|nr:hypothetical protein [Candidatus Kaiserbacteria bacterium]